MSKKKHHHKHEHFEVIYKNCDHGVHANISVVKRESDGKLFIWKRAVSSDPRHQKSFQKEFKKAKLWRKFGTSKVKVHWHPDKRSLLKTYIKGYTLKKMLEKDRLHFSREESEPVKALRKFIGLLINSKHYVKDLNRKNIVFDGKKWHIIDSSDIHKKSTRSETEREYKRKFFESWSKSLDSDEEIHSFESFLDSLKPVKKK